MKTKTFCVALIMCCFTMMFLTSCDNPVLTGNNSNGVSGQAKPNKDNLPNIFSGVKNEPDGSPEQAVELKDNDFEMLKKELNGRPIACGVGEEDKTFLLDKAEITKITITKIDKNVSSVSSSYYTPSSSATSSSNMRTVSADVVIDRDIAVVNCKTSLVYKYEDSAWKITNVEIQPIIQELRMKGKWEGEVEIYSYYGNFHSELRKISFEITDVKSDGLFNTTITLSAHTTTPSAPTCVYQAVGGIDKENGKITLSGIKYISGTFYNVQYDVNNKDETNINQYVITGYYDLSQKCFVQGDGAKCTDSLKISRIAS